MVGGSAVRTRPGDRPGRCGRRRPWSPAPGPGGGNGGKGIGMRALTARRVAYVIGAGSIALIIAAVVLRYVDRHASPPAGSGTWDFSFVFGEAVGIAVPLVGLVLIARRPANRIGWLFLAAGAAIGLGDFSTAYALHALNAAPGSLPAGRAAGWLSNWIWVIPMAALGFLFLLFPTGHLRSARWRPAAWFVGGGFALLGIAAVANATLIWSHPFGHVGNAGFYLTYLIILPATMLASVTAVIVRFAGSAGEERLQLKWFAAAAAVVVVMLVATTLTSSAVVSVLWNLALLCLWVSIGIAVLKYRLYEIDIVISKAVLYGSLAVFITVVYAGLVVGVGTLAGGRDSPLVAALAAAVVAVAFQPARQRAGRLANRVVYGRRATPYQVLSDFARRIGGTYAAEDVLAQMAQIVAAGTGAERVVVWLRVDDELHPEASSGGGPQAAPLPVDGQAMPPVPGADLSVPVVHQGELLGAISVQMPKDEPLRPAGDQ